MNNVEIICTVIGAVASILAGVWFIVQKAQKMAVNEYRLNNMETDVSTLKTDTTGLKTDVSVLKTDVNVLKTDVNALKADVSVLKTDVSLLKNDMSEVKSDISAIKAVLIKKFPNAAEVYSMKKSPRRLNALGEKIFAQIDGKKFLNDNKEFFFSKIDERNPKTALDVEDAANIACSAFTDNDIFNYIKDFVYNAPSLSLSDENGESRKHDISLGDVCYILSLPLRDMYLEEKFKINPDTGMFVRK